VWVEESLKHREALRIGVMKNKYAERKNFYLNHFKNCIIMGLFRPSPRQLRRLFTVVRQLPNGGIGLVFGNGSDGPTPASLDALPVQRDAS
jgi:hypothetical protein